MSGSIDMCVLVFVIMTVRVPRAISVYVFVYVSLHMLVSNLMLIERQARMRTLTATAGQTHGSTSISLTLSSSPLKGRSTPLAHRGQRPKGRAMELSLPHSLQRP
jgi:hypothetical protein